MNIEDQIIDLIREVACMKAQLSTLWKIFIGVAVGSGVNVVLNINAHFKNSKSK